MQHSEVMRINIFATVVVVQAISGQLGSYFKVAYVAAIFARFLLLKFPQSYMVRKLSLYHCINTIKGH